MPRTFILLSSYESINVKWLGASLRRLAKALGLVFDLYSDLSQANELELSSLNLSLHGNAAVDKCHLDCTEPMSFLVVRQA